MKIEEFVSKIRNAKYGALETGSMRLKVFSNKERTQQEIKFDGKMHKFNANLPQEICVIFFNSCRITIFQAGLLFYLFAYNKKPVDYGSYHDCIAGKEFIGNIKAVSVG